jgi:acetyltransferase-like isoleucine patch superfamily enzyme
MIKADREFDQNQRRINQLPYRVDRKLFLMQLKTRLLVRKYNRMRPFNFVKVNYIFKRLGLKHEGHAYFEPPFWCDYGSNIEIGDDFYANTGCVILDVAKVKIGSHCQFGPDVKIITAGHPIHPQTRDSKYEYGIAVTVGDSVWLGAGVTVLPGITIGDNVVIGAGSVVTKDVPPNSVAVGNPCHVIRQITDEDKPYYFKNRKIEDAVLQKIFGTEDSAKN